MGDFLKMFREAEQQGATGSLAQAPALEGGSAPVPQGLAVPAYKDLREQAIIDSRMKDTGSRFLDRFSLAEKQDEIEQRRQQRAYAEQAPPEVAAPVKELLSSSGDRNKVLDIVRKMTPEQREETLRLAPGIAQQLGDDRGGAIGRTLGALSLGVSKGVSQPLMELLGAGGTKEEIEYIRKLDALASQEFAPARPGDPWYESGPLQAAQMTPWMATIVGAGGLGRVAGQGAGTLLARGAAAGVPGAKTAFQAAGAVGRVPTAIGLQGATTKGVFQGAGTLAGITSAAFPGQYAQEVDQLKEIGMEDDWKLRLLAGGTATVAGMVEGIVPNPFGGTVSLKQGAMKAARQYLWEALKKAPPELGEEYLQGVTSGLGQHVAQYIDKDAKEKTIADAFANGWEQTKEAALPMAFLLGVPAVGGAGLSSIRARRYQLEQIRAKNFVSESDAKAAGIEGNSRRERMANVESEIEQLGQQEAEASKQSDQEFINQQQAGVPQVEELVPFEQEGGMTDEEFAATIQAQMDAQGGNVSTPAPVDTATVPPVVPQPTVQQPPVPQQTPASFAARMARGEQMTSPEDQQYRINNAAEIEAELQKLMSPTDTATVPPAEQPLVQPLTDKEFFDQQAGGNVATPEVPTAGDPFGETTPPAEDPWEQPVATGDQQEQPQPESQEPPAQAEVSIEQVPDSVFSAFPDMLNTTEGYISANQFTQEELDALRNAGLVQSISKDDGRTYEGVDPERLWPERQKRAASYSAKRKQRNAEREILKGVPSLIEDKDSDVAWSQLSDDARSALLEWTSGSGRNGSTLGRLREAAKALWQGVKGGIKADIDLLREIFENGKTGRDKLRKQAGENGKITLLRGLRKGQFGSRPAIESFTTDLRTARNFAGQDGTVERVEVDPDDVIYVIGGAESEVLVKNTSLEGAAQAEVQVDELPEPKTAEEIELLPKFSLYRTTIKGKKYISVRGDGARGGGDDLFESISEASAEAERKRVREQNDTESSQKKAEAEKAAFDERSKNMPSYRDWRFTPQARNSGKIVPNRVGVKFLPDQIQAISDWAKSQGYSVFSVSPTGIKVIGPSGSRLDIAMYGAAGVKDEQSKAAKAQREADRRKADEDRKNKADGRKSASWITDTFGNVMGDSNRNALSDFLEGESDKFKGAISQSWRSGLEKVGALSPEGKVDWKKVKAAYVASDPPVPPGMERITDWRKAVDESIESDPMRASSIMRRVAQRTSDDAVAQEILDRLPDGLADRSQVAWDIGSNRKLGEPVRRRAAKWHKEYGLGGNLDAVIDKNPSAKPAEQPVPPAMEFNVGQGARSIPGMEGDEANYTVLKRKPDVIPDTVKVVISGRPGGKGWISVDGTGMTGPEAYDRAMRKYESKRPGPLRDKTRKEAIRKAIEEQGGFDANSTDNVEAIRNKLYDGADTPTGTEIRAVMDEMKIEAGQKAEADASKPAESTPVDMHYPDGSAYRKWMNRRHRVGDHPTSFLTGHSSIPVRDAAKANPGLGLVITPATKQYVKHGGDYSHVMIDNGAFSEFTGTAPFSEDKFFALLDSIVEAGLQDKVQFVVVPDRVGDWQGTTERWKQFYERVKEYGMPLAYVAQDGIDENMSQIPWDGFDVLFIGGSTPWKLGFDPKGQYKDFNRPTDEELSKAGALRSQVDLIKEAKRRGKKIHMGRVNSWKRMEAANYGYQVDSADGNFIGAAPDTNLPKVLGWLEQTGGESFKPAPEGKTEAFRALPAKSQAKFEELWNAGRWSSIAAALRENNRAYRAEFEARTGIKLPKTVKGTTEAVAKWDSEGRKLAGDTKPETGDKSPAQERDERLDELEEARLFNENFIKIVADDVSKIRKQDVYRLLSEVPSERAGSFENWLIKKRPDLTEEINEVSSELLTERASQEKPVEIKDKLDDDQLPPSAIKYMVQGDRLKGEMWRSPTIGGQAGRYGAFYATNEEGAGKYSRGVGVNVVVAQMVELNDPLVVDTKQQAMEELGIDEDSLQEPSETQDIHHYIDIAIFEEATRKGYDGVVYKQEGYDGNPFEVHVFNPPEIGELPSFTVQGQKQSSQAKSEQPEPPAEGEMSVEDFVNAFVGTKQPEPKKGKKPTPAKAEPATEEKTVYSEIKQHAAGMTSTVRATKGGKSLLIEFSKSYYTWSIREVDSKQDIAEGITDLKRAKNVADRIFAGTFDSEADKRFTLTDAQSLSYSNQKLAGLWDDAGRAIRLAATLSKTGFYTDGRMLVKVSDKDRDAILKSANVAEGGNAVSVQGVLDPVSKLPSYSDNEMSPVGYRGGDLSTRIVVLKNKTGHYAVVEKPYHDTIMKRHPTAIVWGSAGKGQAIEQAILYTVDGEPVGVIMPIQVRKGDKYITALIEGKYDDVKQPEAPPPKKPKSLKKEPKEGVKEGLDKAKEGAKLFIEGIKDAAKGNTPFANVPMNEKIARGLGMMADGLIEAGKYKFVDFIESVVELVGIQNARSYAKYLEAGWNKKAESDDRLDKSQSVLGLLETKETKDGDPSSGNYGAPQSPNSVAIGGYFAERFRNGASYARITDARREAAELIGGMPEDGSQAIKAIDEAIELGVVLVARDIAQSGKSDAIIYDELVDLYSRQPNLGTRTSTSIMNQAYSTPAPLAYLANRQAGITSDDTVYDSSAGNGMLLIVGGERVANEINEDRVDALRSQGIETTSEDATEFSLRKPITALAINPPFGEVKTASGGIKQWVVDGVRTDKVDHAITLKSLSEIPEDGKVAIIIGAKGFEQRAAKDDSRRGRAYLNEKSFYDAIYDKYNVVDHYTVHGDLYSRQGASFPIDVIIISGRGKSSRPKPYNIVGGGIPQVFNSWEELKDAKLRSVSGVSSTSTRRDESSDTASMEGGDEVPASGNAETIPAGSSGGRVGAADGGKPRSERLGETDGQPRSGDSVNAERPVAAKSDQDKPIGGDRRQRDAKKPSGSDRGDRLKPDETAETDYQVSYSPGSKNKSVDTLIPRNHQSAVEKSLDSVAEIYGDIDEFVAKELGYTVSEMEDAFSAEQVDALALAIARHKDGGAFILGDQTGVGKGRVVAAMITYANRQGLVPVFVTEKPTLYADMMRDIIDIGQSTEKEPFNVLITNSLSGKDVVPLPDGRKLKQSPDAAKSNLASAVSSVRDGRRLSISKPSGRGKKRVYEEITYGALFTTYSQLQPVKQLAPERAVLLKSISQNSFYILDESHNAGGGGESDPAANQERRSSGQDATITRAEIIRDLISESAGVFFSSATYAKRPQTMGLYARTGMAAATGNSADSLSQAIATGGVPLQQVVSEQLVESGMYLRRERSFDGVEFNPKTVGVDLAKLDKVSAIFSAINAMDVYAQEAIEAVADEITSSGGAIRDTEATGRAGVESTSFSSILHNLVDQMLLALKADAVADETIASIRAGESPVIYVDSTLEAALKRQVDDLGAEQGEVIDFSYRDLVRRYLERSREYTIRQDVEDADSVIRIRLTDAELGPAGVAAYELAERMINEFNEDMPASPIDWIRKRVTDAGYSIGEITGRQIVLDYDSDGKVRLGRRLEEEAGSGGRTLTVKKFNDGTLDAVLINQSGSTGVSMHASEKFENKKPRHMIIGQPARNIDTFMQALGRVHRTGQVVLPRFTLMMTDAPAEIRPASVLVKKLSSLNANVTASAKGSVSFDVPDVINVLGDQIVAEYLADNRELDFELGELVQLRKNGTPKRNAGIAKKASGRMALRPVEEQKQFWDSVVEAYDELVNELNRIGKNPLLASTLDLQAKTIESTVIFEGDTSSDNAFSQPASVETIRANKPGEPMKPDDVSGAIDAFYGKPLSKAVVNEWVESAVQDAIGAYEEYVASRTKGMTGEELRLARAGYTTLGNQQLENLRNRLRAYAPGMSVSVYDRNSDGSLQDVSPGFVIKAKRSKGGNPLIASKWSIDVAIASPDRIAKTALSRTGEQEPEGSDNYREFLTNRELISETRLREFGETDTSPIETRYVGVGNILAAYSQLGAAGGKIAFFTDSSGNVRRGVLMPRSFNIDRWANARPVVLDTLDQVNRFLNSGRYLATPDRALTVSRSNGKLVLSAPKAKSKGGKYTLNQGILGAASPVEFVSIGNRMEMKVEESAKQDAVLNAVLSVAALQANDPTHKDFAREIKAAVEAEAQSKLSGSLRSAPDVLHQTQNGDVHSMVQAKVIELGIAANKAGVTDFEDFIAYAVKTVGEDQTRFMGGYLQLAATRIGMKGVRPVKDILGVPMTQEQYVQLAKQTFVSVPGEQVESGIEAASLVLPQMAVGFSPAGTPVPAQGLKQQRQVQTDTPAFKAWFGDSKVVDEDGEPLVVYHGTASSFESFDLRKVGSATDSGSLGSGFYFSSDPQVIERRQLGMAVYLSLSNPLIISMPDFKTEKLDLVTSLLGVANTGLNAETSNAIREAAISKGYDGVILDYSPTGYQHREFVAFEPTQIKSATGNRGTFDPNNPNMLYQEEVSASQSQMEQQSSSRISPEIEKELDAGEKVTLYRAMMLIDGKLYPPMSGKVADDSGKVKTRDPETIGKWMRSEERPDLIAKSGRNAGKFKLEKAGGDGSDVWVVYAPYFHASPMPLNDQFSAAWLNDGVSRPQLVTVEIEVPKSELTSGYQAQNSPKKVGANKWQSGVVASKIPGGRDVVLSRYARIKRIVPDAEVAKKIAEIVNPARLSVPENTVTPQLRAELEKNGVRISPQGTSGDDVFYQTQDGKQVDADAIPNAVLSKMSGRLRSMGYDSRGAEDVRRGIKERSLLEFNEDWIAAYRFAIGSEQARQDKAAAKKDLKNVNWARLSELGTTSDPNEAGYIKPDGELADFSGKREGGQRGTRSFDHREAGGTAGMQEVIAYGWVRMDENSGSLDIAKMPTPAQLSAITRMAQRKFGEIVLDLEDGLGEWRETDGYYINPRRRWSQQYPEGTKPQRIINDIKKFFGGDTPNTLFQKAYHGSPYRFSKFTLDHIGKGEGAQAYGWGLYFADKRQVADYYRETLAKPFVAKWTIGATPLVRTDKNGDAQYYDYSPRTSKDSDVTTASIIEEILVNQIHIESAFAESGVKAAKEKTKQVVENQIEIWKEEWPEGVEHARRFIREIDRKFEMEIESPGALYQVEIPESDEYLLWDKPMEQQSDKVKAVLRGINPEDLGLRFESRGASGEGVYLTPRKTTFGKRVNGPVDSIWDLVEDGTGMTFYYDLAAQRGVSESAAERWASEFLAKRGIRGMKYLDQNSRFATAGEESFNYVIYDASDVVISEALFQKETQQQGGNVKGWTKFISGTRALIGATSKADISTVIHEFAHPIRRFLLNRDVPQDQRADITDEEISMLEEKCGVKDGVWDVQSEEKLARMWELYWFEGKSPNAVLKSLFEKISRWMHEVYTSAMQISGARLDDDVRKLFDKLVQRNLPADQRAPDTESVAPQTSRSLDGPVSTDLTSIKNEVAGYLAMLRNSPGLVDVAQQTQQEWLDEAAFQLSKDSMLGDRLVKELNANARNLSNIEVAILQLHSRRLNNALETASVRLFTAVDAKDSEAAVRARVDTDMLINHLEELDKATKKAGREWGRAGVARQIMLERDFSLAALRRKARVAKAGQPLSKDQSLEIEALAKEIADLEGELAKVEQEKADLERQLALKQSVDDAIQDPANKPTRSTAKQKATDKMRGFVQTFANVFKPKGKDTQTLQQTEDEQMAEQAEDVIRAYVDSGVFAYGQLLANLRKDIGEELPLQVQRAFAAAWAKIKAQGEIPVPAYDRNDLSGLTKIAREIEASLIQGGIVSKDDPKRADIVLDAVHESLMELDENITRRETIDALSRYGQFTPLSKDETKVLMRDINGQLLQIAKAQDLEAGILPKATGPERREMKPEERELVRKVNELKRTSNLYPKDTEGLLETAIGAALRTAQNRIFDLRKARDTNTPIEKTQVDLTEGKESDTPLTAKARQQLANTRKELAEENRLYRLAFPRPGATKEQRLAAAIKIIDREIARVESQINTRDFLPKDRPDSVTSAELEAKQSRLAALRAQRLAILAEEFPQYAEKRKELAYIANLKNRYADYSDRMENRFFGPKPKKAPRKLSPEEIEIKRQLEDIKERFFRLAAEFRLSQMSPKEKAWDYTKEASYLARAIMTSFDLSAVFRQGGPGTFSHPKLAVESAKEMRKALFSQAVEFEIAERMQEHPSYDFWIQAGLDITANSDKIQNQEEAYSGRLVRDGIGKKGTKLNTLSKAVLSPVKASGRAYTTYLNGLRFRLAKYFEQNLGAQGQLTLDEAKVIARFINVSTGRSDLGSFNKVAASASTVLFAPRYMLSRFQYLAMPFYLLPDSKVSGRVRKLIAAEYARHALGVMGFLGTAVAFGSLLYDDDDEEKPTVELDPRSSDFLKLKIGETRIDPLSGFGQVTTFMTQVALGQKKTMDGEIRNIRGEDRKYGDDSTFDVIANFGRKKLAPVPGAGVNLIAGEDVVGGKATAFSVTTGLFIPLAVKEVLESLMARGVPEGPAIAMLNVLGMSGGTYGPKTKYKNANPEERKKLFEKDLKAMEWDSKDPAYSQYLTNEQVQQVSKQREARKQSLVYAAAASPNRKDYRDTETFEQADASRQKAMDALVKSGMTFEECRQLLIDYYKRNYGSAFHMQGGRYVMKESLANRLRQIRQKLGQK